MAQVQYYGTGRRKSSVARVRLVPGSGKITINDRAFADYIPSAAVRLDVLQPLNMTNTQTSYDVLVKTAAIKKGKTGLMFIGVCTAALFIIPAVCSAVIKPVMDAMGMKTPQKNQKETPTKLDIKEGTQDNVAKTPQIYQPIKQIEKTQVKNN